MFTIVIRVIIIYLVVLFLYRVMGKRQIGEMQPFELVLTLIIADLATIPMAEVNIPVLHGIVPLLTLFILHTIIIFICQKSDGINRIICGKPVIVINPKGIDYKALKALNISIDDVFEAMRGCGYFKLEQVQYAIMETTGKMSIMPKGGCAPVTNEDLKLKVQEAALPINIVSEGKVLKDNLKIARISFEKIMNEVKKFGVRKIKDILILTLDKNGEVFLQKKYGEYTTFQIEMKGE